MIAAPFSQKTCARTPTRLQPLGVLACLLAAAFLAATTGCGPSGQDRSDDKGAALVTLEVASLAEIRERIASYKGKKIVVVDVWSTSCPPCMNEFPGLVALSEKHADDVACISVSVDFEGGKNKKPEDVSAKVLGFLKEQKAAKVQNILSSTPSDEVQSDEELVGGAIPVVLVYARDGSVAKKFTDAEPFTYADVTKKVDELRAAKP
jgi:thiol-disulfide isomerase/thioredoxin